MSTRLGNIENTDGYWDRLGIWLSGLCVIHCVLTPLLLTALPISSSFFNFESWTHWILALLLIPTVVIGFRSSIRKGRATYVRVLFLLGGLLVLAGLLVGENYPEIAETILTIIGGLFLVAGHWKNWKGDK